MCDNDGRLFDDRDAAFGSLMQALEAPGPLDLGPITQRHAAYHEAGHAVVARRRGLLLSRCSIVPNSENLGRVRCHPSRHEDLAQVRRDQAAFSWGGVVAQSILYGRVTWTGAVHDFCQIAVDVRAYPEESDGLLVTERRWVEDLLREPRNWHAVEVLARRLLRSKDLDGRQTVMVIDRARRAVA